MITIHQFYVPANCRKVVYSDEIQLVTGVWVFTWIANANNIINKV